MKNKSLEFLCSEQGAVSTQIGLGLALVCECLVIVADWISSF